MKNILVIVVSLLIPFSINAQEENKQQKDTIFESRTSSQNVSIGLEELANLRTDYDRANTWNKKLNIENVSLRRKDSVNVNKIEQQKYKIEQQKSENTKLQDEVKRNNEYILMTDKKLINLASNFLYIPYEMYSVQQIAIPAYESIANDTLKQKYNIRFELLKSYQNDIKSLKDYLVKAEEELSVPFSTNNDASKLKIDFEKQSFYKNYSRYKDSKTYMWKLFIKIQNRLTNFDKESGKANFTDIITELDKCLKTTEES